MKLKKMLSMILVVALVVTTASITPSIVGAKTRKKYIKSIKMSQSSATILVGKTKKIGVKVKTKGRVSKKFTVSIKNNSVAGVSKKGKSIFIKGKKPGHTKVIVKSKSKNKKGKRIKKTINVFIVESKNNSGRVVRKKTIVTELLINDPDIDVGVEKNVTFIGDIDNSEEEAYPVIKKNGDVLGYIYDDGCGKDEYEGDGIYTGEITLFSNVEKEEKYYVLLGNTASEEYATAFFYKTFTENEEEKATYFQQELSKINRKFDGKTEESARQVFDEAKEYINSQKNSGLVKSYDVEENGISIELSSNISFVFPYPTLGGARGNSAFKLIGNNKEIKSGMYNANRSTVATFEPFKSEFPSNDFDEAARKLVNSDYNYEFAENVDGAGVTVEKAKHLDDYNAVLWCGHGGYDSKNHSYTCLAEKVGWLEGLTKIYNYNKYYKDIKAGRLIVCSSDELCITSKFIDRYYSKNSFKNTFFYMGTCLGARDSVLGNSFVKKGVGAFIAYENETNDEYDNRMVQQFVGQMVSGNKTAAEALNLCKGFFGDPSKMRIIGNAGYKFSSSNAINAADKYDIVLTWGADPCDMDSHLEGYNANNEPFHVYYGDDEAYENGNLICQLDYDDTSSYGPETVSLKTTSSRTYYYYVHRYEGDGSVNTSQSVVKVYKNGVLKHTYYVGENNGYGDYWNVFAIKNGRFVERNTITNDPDTSY